MAELNDAGDPECGIFKLLTDVDNVNDVLHSNLDIAPFDFHSLTDSFQDMYYKDDRDLVIGLMNPFKVLNTANDESVTETAEQFQELIKRKLSLISEQTEVELKMEDPGGSSRKRAENCVRVAGYGQWALIVALYLSDTPVCGPE